MAICIQLNGEKRSFDASLSVSELLVFLDLPLEKIAVERNREIVPRSLFATTTIDDGDQLEIIHFIGGG